MESVLRWIDRAIVDDREILIATDFDGTLAEISNDPDEVVLSHRAASVLSALAHGRSMHVAVLSGRTLSDLIPRVRGVGPVWLASDHGGVVLDPEHRIQPLERSVTLDGMRALEARASELARVFRGARVEAKTSTITLHFREVAEHKHDALIEMFRLACITQRAKPIVGRRVIEGRFGDADKGRALAHIMGRLPAGTALICVGDDTTDEPALRYAFDDPFGLALFMYSGEHLAPRVSVNGWLRSPDEWLEILEALAMLRGRHRGAA